MSRFFEALSQLKTADHAAADRETARAQETNAVAPPEPEPEQEPETRTEYHTLKVVPAVVESSGIPPVEAAREATDTHRGNPTSVEPPAILTITAAPSRESNLVAWTDPNSLGAEKFRALVTRFDHLREQHELKSFQVTSSVDDEGKTVVAANTAVTLAKYSGAKTLLVEGDLHRPNLAGLLGLHQLSGLSQWWEGDDQDLTSVAYRLKGLPLWLLPAGNPLDQPSDLLRSERFREAFQRLSDQFEWIVVDSTPMLPIIDVNLWSRMLDGMLLVVREGVAPVKALKSGLQALDRPRLVGVVVNEASESTQAGYAGKYYRRSLSSEAI